VERIRYLDDQQVGEFLLLLKPHFICNLYIYVQQISVRIGCYALRRGTHWCPSIVITIMSLVGRGGNNTYM
jgi:hypothetical protein